MCKILTKGSLFSVFFVLGYYFEAWLVLTNTPFLMQYLNTSSNEHKEVALRVTEEVSSALGLKAIFSWVIFLLGGNYPVEFAKQRGGVFEQSDSQSSVPGSSSAPVKANPVDLLLGSTESSRNSNWIITFVLKQILVAGSSLASKQRQESIINSGLSLWQWTKI